ncbi:TauD/TfdA family dioxygenase [Pseudemcibacter aquimaris]|uniref:TauD/TfdA family dioxygenase n=1 Tax=Pseudemcibacter aquimaris TaxID=2857064 RepID=UPI002010E2DA|nr:TauD/TfdA family dioxygenase [Pseudemcibacter aquimaris]MCC3861312.1 TauD/TfdA family dioxygenase [Pseudemcibacter aquimaris]WDU58085.1 TauD/TfdA family dioxygenase [Pseudemcibacter aquimaris]
MSNHPPERIERPSAWIGKNMAANPDKWLTYLDPEEIQELEHAADHFLETSKNIGEITINDFPLPLLSGRLASLKETLINGIGFEVIRGLPINEYSKEKAACIFCGIGAHLGSARSQNAAGHILGHVRNVGADANDPNTRIYQTSERQTFHTDSADVVGLMCLKTAKEGGGSLLVSTETIYNKMMRVNPELTALLFDNIATDRRGEVPDGQKPYFEIPVLNWHDEKLTGMYQRQYIESAQRFPDAPRLTNKHIQALDLFDSLANDPDLHFRMELKEGDLQFVYNHSQLHDREGFTDHPEPENRRHLYRLWLSLDGDRELPECFKERYGSIEIGNRGGIITPETKLTFEID